MISPVDDFEEETIYERIMALEEMLPNSVKTTFSTSIAWTKTIFNASKKFSWIVASTAAILVLPINLEIERAEYLEQVKRQERNILMGPDTL